VAGKPHSNDRAREAPKRAGADIRLMSTYYKLHSAVLETAARKILYAGALFA